MHQTYKVKRLKVKKFVRAARDTIWAERTGLEQILLLVSAGLVGLLVAALVALARKSAPLATEWGPVADWVGVFVTFLGFVGAIAALRFQTKSVAVQLEQHNKQKETEETEEQERAAARKAEALEAKQKDARAVQINVSAIRRQADPGSEFVYEQPFVVTCTLVFPGWNLYTEANFQVPDTPENFRQLRDDRITTKFGIINHGARIIWQISGNKWPHGDEAGAQAWVAARTFATFTDQAGNKWKLDGAGKLTDVSG
ncbi:hypothetical protein GCM10009636_24940 [Arthrobacter koreensis]|jgi:hypothetical protein|uniref:hypothetical protein n=1 Tax=Arthrobacter koreensis TaxID=199136 RepID=UPI000A6FE5E4|nr:hypothetical protein [Arthrobacter koreensis]MDF2497129.1 hypothetical protein [Arthrobacter koreensis]